MLENNERLKVLLHNAIVLLEDENNMNLTPKSSRLLDELGMSDEEYDDIMGTDEDKHYYIYVLGYDLLQKTLNGVECDIAYDICEYVYELFTQSEEFTDYSMSGYDALTKFTKNHKSEIIDYMRTYYLNGRKVELC